MNNLLPPKPQSDPYTFGGTPYANAAGRATASNNAQIMRNQALMGGKVKKRKSLKKRKSSKKRKSLKKKKRRSSKKRFNKRGGANNFQVQIVPAPYPSASGGSQNTTATQLLNGGNFAQSKLYSANDKYATIK
jgi:hypothetical protein